MLRNIRIQEPAARQRSRSTGWRYATTFGWIVGAVLGSASESAGMDTAQMCDHAARIASENHSVPLDVLRAVTRTETGRTRSNRLQPWPWTVNMEGAGHWFATEDEARAFVFSHFKRGARSFDVGCFQINYKWHGAAFRSIDEMFDPILNAQYAAKFLTELFREHGDWSAAAGAFHSRTPEYADSYSARFDEIRINLTEANATLPVQIASDMANNKPRGLGLGQQLINGPLIGRGNIAMGSLVPLAGSQPPAIGAFVVLN